MAKYEIVYHKDLDWTRYQLLARNNFEMMLMVLWKFSKENEDKFKLIISELNYKNLDELIRKAPYEPTPKQKKIFDTINYHIVDAMIEGDFRIQYVKNLDTEICIFGEDPDIKNGKGDFLKNKEQFEISLFRIHKGE